MAEQNGTAGLVIYKDDRGQEIKLSPAIIRKYLVSGPQGTVVTDQEVVMFLTLCKYQHLNPFLREAYLIKFGSTPATIVTGKDVFTRRASNTNQCAGWRAGIIVKTKDGIEDREGTILLDTDELIGGWAEIHRHDWTVPLKHTASLKEFERRKRDGSLMANWASMPATMIRKVALVQALREAFPDNLGGMYSQEEMPVDGESLDSKPVEVVEGVPDGARPVDATATSSATVAVTEEIEDVQHAGQTKPAEEFTPEASLAADQEIAQSDSNAIDPDALHAIEKQLQALVDKFGNWGKLITLAREVIGTHIMSKDSLLSLNEGQMALLEDAVEAKK